MVVRLAGLARSPSAGPVPAWPGWLVGGRGGVYTKLPGDYTARIKPLRRGWRTVPASWLAEFWRAGFQSPPQSVRHRLPVPVRPWPLVLVRRGSSPTWCRSSGGRGPPAGSGPCCRSRSGVVLLWRGAGPLVGAVLWCRSGSRSGAAISESNRDFSAPYTGPKISSDFPGEVFYAHGLSLVSWYINAPL